MVLAGRRADVRTVPTRLGKRELLTVATSYPKLLGEFACKKGLNLAVSYTPRGSVEAYAATGRSDLIFDITQTGRTITANDLVIYREDNPLTLKVVDRLTKNDDSQGGDELLSSLNGIYQTMLRRIRESRESDDSDSLTIALCRDQNAVVKKYGEESAELLQEYLRRPTSQVGLIDESADVLYIASVMLAQNGVSLADVLREAIRRNQNSRI